MTGRHGYSVDSREPTWCNGSTLAQNIRDVGSIPALGTLFPVFITPITLVAMARILYKLYAVWLLNLPCVYICKVIACIM